MNIVDLRSGLPMVLDSGPGQASLAGWGLDRQALTHVLLTHWHPDHAASAT
jgi:glyoxylase-like metal-dependent hydrolase (beta-lactamase superfamily II)